METRCNILVHKVCCPFALYTWSITNTWTKVRLHTACANCVRKRKYFWPLVLLCYRFNPRQHKPLKTSQIFQTSLWLKAIWKRHNWPFWSTCMYRFRLHRVKIDEKDPSTPLPHTNCENIYVHYRHISVQARKVLRAQNSWLLPKNLSANISNGHGQTNALL